MPTSCSHAGQAPQATAVPTHFYKVVFCERQDKQSGERQTAMAAFAMPNRPIDPATPLTSFVVPLEFLESVTGIEFFPGALAEGRQRNALDSAAAGVGVLIGIASLSHSAEPWHQTAASTCLATLQH